MIWRILIDKFNYDKPPTVKYIESFVRNLIVTLLVTVYKIHEKTRTFLE